MRELLRTHTREETGSGNGTRVSARRTRTTFTLGHSHKSLLDVITASLQVAFPHFLQVVRLHIDLPFSHELHARDEFARGGRVSPGFIAPVEVSRSKAELREQQSGHVSSLADLAIDDYVSRMKFADTLTQFVKGMLRALGSAPSLNSSRERTSMISCCTRSPTSSHWTVSTNPLKRFSTM